MDRAVAHLGLYCDMCVPQTSGPQAEDTCCKYLGDFWSCRLVALIFLREAIGRNNDQPDRFGTKGQTFLINMLYLEHNHRIKGSDYLQFRNGVFILTVGN